MSYVLETASVTNLFWSELSSIRVHLLKTTYAYENLKKKFLHIKHTILLGRYFREPSTSPRAHPNPQPVGSQVGSRKGRLLFGMELSAGGRGRVVDWHLGPVQRPLSAGRLTSLHLCFPGVFAN